MSFIPQYNIDSSWRIYCYEPNPIIYDEALKVLDQLSGFNIKFHNQAIMDQSGSITINCRVGAYVDGVYKKAFTMGSTVFDTPVAEKVNEKNEHMVFEYVQREVESVDINSIVDEICLDDPDAELYIKCDIEAAEFVVLPKLLESKNVTKIKDIHIEWHERFWKDPEEYQQRLNEKASIESSLNNLNIRYFRHG